MLKYQAKVTVRLKICFVVLKNIFWDYKRKYQEIPIIFGNFQERVASFPVHKYEGNIPHCISTSHRLRHVHTRHRPLQIG